MTIMKGEISMQIERVYIGQASLGALLQVQIEKEIEKILNAAYNENQVDIVATGNGGRQ